MFDLLSTSAYVLYTEVLTVVCRPVYIKRYTQWCSVSSLDT